MDAIARRIASVMKAIGRPVRLMEVCGTHTVAIFRHGIRGLLPPEIRLLSGPGCPVCVTAIRDVDKAVAIAGSEGVVMTTFGDMMRVPGSRKSLFDAKAEGGDIRIVYSPLDALKIAQELPGRKVVFFATGFETTSPLIAGTLVHAQKSGLANFFIYPVHKTVPPALQALLSSGEVLVDGFLLPGHVSTIIGAGPYEFIAGEFGKPCVVTGFDAEDILSAILMLVEQIAAGRSKVEIQYTDVVKKEGNPKAVALLEEFFEPEDAEWRGIGVIPKSGLRLRSHVNGYDIRSVCDPDVSSLPEPLACSCGEVLKGMKIPSECKLFGKICTPEKPVGACMVSTEGSCAAYYKYEAFRNGTAV